MFPVIIHLLSEDSCFDNKVSIKISLPYIPNVNSRLWLTEEHKEELVKKIKNLTGYSKTVYSHMRHIDDYCIVYAVAYNETDNVTDICLSDEEYY